MESAEDPVPPLEERPVVVEFPHVDGHRTAAPDHAGRADRARRAAGGWLSYLLPSALLAGACIPLVVVMRRPVGLFGWVVGAAFTALLLWVVVSTLWPARPDRKCPECGDEALRRLDPETTHGLRCASCGWSDPHESAWLLAEEEGPLEEVVLRDRGRDAPGSQGRPPSVDNGRPNDYR